MIPFQHSLTTVGLLTGLLHLSEYLMRWDRKELFVNVNNEALLALVRSVYLFGAQLRMKLSCCCFKVSQTFFEAFYYKIN